MIKHDETKVVVVAQFTAKKGKEQLLLEALHELMAPTHQEPGYIRYELNQDVADPANLTFIEKFKDQDAFEIHKNKPYITTFFQSVAPQLVDRQVISLHKEILP
jgi:quinol monooxygenase YgiN